MKRQFLIVIIGLVIVALGIGFWFYFSKQPKEKSGGEKAVPPEVQAGFGSKIIEKVGENPAAKMPETNPFNKEINPLENVYKNPFE